MKYLIDTDIASYFLRGKYSLDTIFEQKDPAELILSVVSVAELRVLAYKNPQSKLNISTINRFAQRVGVLDLDEDAWDIFSRTKAELLQRGNARGDLDLLQAAIAKRHDLIVVTHNTKHYDGIVGFEDWAGQIKH
jgi:tRNA(fMet)-specific endonuclease VapC